MTSMDTTPATKTFMPALVMRITDRKAPRASICPWAMCRMFSVWRIRANPTVAAARTPPVSSPKMTCCTRTEPDPGAAPPSGGAAPE